MSTKTKNLSSKNQSNNQFFFTQIHYMSRLEHNCNQHKDIWKQYSTDLPFFMGNAMCYEK